MLWTIVAVLLILWMLGFGLGMGGSLIHMLLGLALAVFAISLGTWRRGSA